MKSNRRVRFNLGTGHGHSVMNIINAVQNVTGKLLLIKETDRRPGDPPVLVAEAKMAHSLLGWEPELTDLEFICKDLLELACSSSQI